MSTRIFSHSIKTLLSNNLRSHSNSGLFLGLFLIQISTNKNSEVSQHRRCIPSKCELKITGNFRPIKRRLLVFSVSEDSPAHLALHEWPQKHRLAKFLDHNPPVDQFCSHALCFYIWKKNSPTILFWLNFRRKQPPWCQQTSHKAAEKNQRSADGIGGDT